MPVEQIFPVIIMATSFTVSPIFWTLVFIFFPARLVKYMLAFYNDFVADFEGGFAEIAIRFDQDTVVTHVFADIASDVFSLENQITETWSDELEDYVK